MELFAALIRPELLSPVGAVVGALSVVDDARDLGAFGARIIGVRRSTSLQTVDSVSRKWFRQRLKFRHREGMVWGIEPLFFSESSSSRSMGNGG